MSQIRGLLTGNRSIISLAYSFGLRSMIFAIISLIYAATILFFVGTAALILLAWARRRYPDRSPNDWVYIAVGIILIGSAGMGIAVASQIILALDYMR